MNDTTCPEPAPPTNYLYGGPDDERLDAHDLEAYVDHELNQDWPNLPAVIEVQRYTPAVVDWKRVSAFGLESFYEFLDCENGPVDEASDVDPAIQTAWDAFMRVVEDEYHVWRCSADGPVEIVNVCEYVSEHHPDWFSHPALSIERREDVA